MLISTTFFRRVSDTYGLSVEFYCSICYTESKLKCKEVRNVTKIDIFSGFLGAGKTTLIKKLISEAYVGEKLVLIENEFGEIGIDGGFMKEAGIQVNEMNSGCICCSLVGDFKTSLSQVLETFKPDRILIEPSGVGKLSDVIKAAQQVESDDVKLNSFTTVVDAGKCKVYSKNFGQFYNDQIQHAGCIVFSRTDGVSQEKLDEILTLVREKNVDATIITTPWHELDGSLILAAMEKKHSIHSELEHLAEDMCPVCGHHHDHDGHHHHHHEGERDCHEHHHHEHAEHHHHDDECDCHEHHHDHDHHHHEHHHHHHEDDCDCHEHHHHQHDGEECHCHDHHHHHHSADDVFSSWGTETINVYSLAEIEAALHALADDERYGTVLRAKGIVAGDGGQWIHFDYVPGDVNVRYGGADVIGKVCVIGAAIHDHELMKLFRV